jgi:hypothetical protein
MHFVSNILYILFGEYAYCWIYESVAVFNYVHVYCIFFLMKAIKMWIFLVFEINLLHSQKLHFCSTMSLYFAHFLTLKVATQCAT